MVVGGLGLAVAGGWFTVDNAVFLSQTNRASGTVVLVEKVRGHRGTSIYYPSVRYRHGKTGEQTSFKSRPGLWPSPFAVGDRVTVAYRSDDPANAKVVSFWTLWFLPTCTILVGLGSICGGLSTLTERRREQTRSNESPSIHPGGAPTSTGEGV